MWADIWAGICFGAGFSAVVFLLVGCVYVFNLLTGHDRDRLEAKEFHRCSLIALQRRNDIGDTANEYLDGLCATLEAFMNERGSHDESTRQA